MVEKQTVQGCCPLDCPDTCAWQAHVEDGKVVSVQGDQAHPFTRGVLCAKVNDYPARTYSPNRLMHPLRRTGAKGDGQFERITWDEAVDTIAGHFDEIITRHGAESIMPVTYYGSMGAVQKFAPLRLLNALGTSDMHGVICGQPGLHLMSEGHSIGLDPDDYGHAKFIILWGVNVLSTGHHHWHFLNEARKKNGARIVSIDPRRTRTAAKSDEHIALRPGTDAALAAGMARVMFEEGLADLEFARKMAQDVDAYRKQVQYWTPERVAEECGIDADTVVTLAREFASSKPAMIRCGIGPQQTVHGEAFVWSLSALCILAGHDGSPGGGLSLLNLSDFNLALAGRSDLKQEKTRSLDIARLGPILTGEDAGPPVHGIMVWGINPAVVLNDTGQVRRGLEREDLFTVVLEHFMTDTARYADIILPATTQLEHFDMHGAWGHYYLMLNKPAIKPLGEAKSHGEIVRVIARRMGLNHPALQESDEEIAASVLPPGLTLADFEATGWQKHSPPPRATPQLDKRVSLTSYPVRAVPSAPEGTLQMLTPKAHYFLNSSFANMERQRRAEGAPALEMNDEDAARRGLSDGQRVVIRNNQGSLQAGLKVTQQIRSGTVSLAGKWWSHPNETAAVGNVLTPATWSASGQPAYNDTFVEVERVELHGPTASH